MHPLSPKSCSASSHEAGHLYLASQVSHPEFPEKLRFLEQQCDIEQLPPLERWSVHKECIRLAATQISRQLFLPGALRGAGGEASRDMRNAAMSHIARVVWYNQANRARIILQRCPLAQKYIAVVGSPAEVRLLDAPGFAADFDALKAEIAAAASGPAVPMASPLEGASDRQSSGTRRTGQGLEVLAKLWSPFGKRATLVAVVNEAGERATDVKEMTDALRAHWRPTFMRQHASVNGVEAKAFLRAWCPCLKGEHMPAPTLERMETFSAQGTPQRAGA